jgi:hypothetical protein
VAEGEGMTIEMGLLQALAGGTVVEYSEAPVEEEMRSTRMPPARSQQQAWRGVMEIEATGADPPCTPKITQGSVSPTPVCCRTSPVFTPFTARAQP